MSFSRYPEYKDSGIEWLGSIPEHWQQKWLGLLSVESSTAFVDGPFGSDLKSSDYQDEGVPLIQLNNIRDGRHVLRNMKFISDDKKDQLNRHSTFPGDIVIAKMADPVARSAIVSNEYSEYVIVADCVKMTPNLDLVELSFLVWAVNSDCVRISAELASSGVTRIRINLAQIKKLKIPYPPVIEQTQIARFLDHETAKIDALIEQQQRLIELLKEKSQAVISHAVTKGLDPTVPMKDSGVEWLGEVPVHWERKRLKYVSPLITVGIVVNPSSYVAEEGLPFLYGGEVREGYIEVDKARKISPEDSKKNRKTMLETGDIVTMRVGYPGLTAVVTPECEGGNCASVMLIKRGNYNSSWLCAVMNSRLIRQQVEVVQYGAAQKQFNISDAVEFWFFQPPRDEQLELANFIQAKSKQFDGLMSEASKSLAILKERRSALISAAVTGKIDVRNWQPPASNKKQEPQQEVAHG